MTTAGMLIMIFAVGGMTLFLLWCVSKVVGTPGSTEHLHAQADIHPPDEKED